MRGRYIWPLVVCAAVVGCGRANEPANAATERGASAPAASSALIPADALARCAGFTVNTAAAIVGASPVDLTDDSRPEASFRMCLYHNPGDRTKAVAFTLRREDSIESAAASMRSERESMGSAQAAIDQVTGHQSKGAAVADVSSIGDEAFYSPLNDAVMLRVRNVIAQVTAPEDMALKSRVAREVAEGLRR